MTAQRSDAPLIEEDICSAEFRHRLMSGRLLITEAEYLCDLALSALRSETAPKIPDGSVVVPREPTDEMLGAGAHAAFGNRSYGGMKTLRKAYIAMISAAPVAATPKGNDGVIESLIGQLRRPISHTECDDPWYSCSQHDSCADDRRAGQPCDCGAQVLNELHAHSADALERCLERSQP